VPKKRTKQKAQKELHKAGHGDIKGTFFGGTGSEQHYKGRKGEKNVKQHKHHLSYGVSCSGRETEEKQRHEKKMEIPRQTVGATLAGEG